MMEANHNLLLLEGNNFFSLMLDTPQSVHYHNHILYAQHLKNSLDISLLYAGLHRSGRLARQSWNRDPAKEQ